MSGEDFGAYIDRLYDEELALKSTHTIAFSTALERLARWEGVENAQAKAIEYLSKGLWVAVASKAYYRAGVSEPFGTANFDTKLRFIEQAKYLGKGALEVLGPGVILRNFWQEEHRNASKDWVVTFGFCNPEGARLRVDKGEAETFTTYYYEGGEAAESVVVALTCYGIEIRDCDVEAMAPATVKSATKVTAGGRPDKYDWSRAIAAVAGRQMRQDFVPDFYANGAQAAIGQALQEWFAANSREPGSTAIKEKAKIILDEWKAEGAKSLTDHYRP